MIKGNQWNQTIIVTLHTSYCKVSLLLNTVHFSALSALFSLDSPETACVRVCAACFGLVILHVMGFGTTWTLHLQGKVTDGRNLSAGLRKAQRCIVGTFPFTC
jgi:hypothetical protein